MATRMKAVEPDEQENTFDFDENTFNADALNPALESLYAEMGMTEGFDATVHVSKLDVDGRGKESNVWRGDPDNYDLEQIAKSFGSGDYRVKIFVKIPTGQKVQKGNKVISWTLSPEDETKRTAPPVPIVQPSLSPEAITKMITDGIGASMANIVPMLRQSEAPAVDPMAMLTQVMTLAKLMTPPAAVPVDPLDQMRKMAEITALMNEGREPAATGKAGTNDVIITMIDKFGPAFAAVLSNQQGAQPQQQMQPQLNAPQPEEQDVNAIMQMKLKMGLAFLVQQCVAGGLPETYAEVVLDSVPEETIDVWTKDDAAIQNTVNELSQLDPNVKAHEVWFIALMKSCREMLTADPESPQGDA